MERYLMFSGAILAIAAFVPAIFFILRGMYHFVAMLRHYRSERHQSAANFVGFLVPFAPQFFTATIEGFLCQGERHVCGIGNWQSVTRRFPPLRPR
jgi:hypothetical protein